MIGDEKAETEKAGAEKIAKLDPQIQEDLPGGIFDDREEEPVEKEKGLKRRVTTREKPVGESMAKAASSSASGSAGGPAGQDSAGGSASHGSAGGPANQGLAGSTAPQNKSTLPMQDCLR